jgi:hypothetical protein
MPVAAKIDPVEAREIAFLRPRIPELVRNQEGLTVYQLGLLAKLTGSKAVIRTYRARLNAIGPHGRNEEGIVE